MREIKGSKYPGIHGLEFSDFKQQIDYFQKNYNVMRMEDVIDCLINTSHELPKKAMLLTFDDGYIDHYDYVYPYLAENHMQGSFYVPAIILNEEKTLDANKIHFILERNEAAQLLKQVNTYVDKLFHEGKIEKTKEQLYKQFAVANRWDDKNTMYIKRLLQNELPLGERGQIVQELFEQSVHMDEKEFTHELYMDLSQMNEMKQEGMYFGLHGYDHFHLGDIPIGDAKEDIEKALDFYKSTQLFNIDEWVMNFPYGSYNEQLLSMIRSKGCVAGLSVDARVASLTHEEQYILPRFDTNDFKDEVKK